jgi:hypothetical protein
MRKNKKPMPITIIPKALPRIEREVIITCETPIKDDEYHKQLEAYALSRFNHTIRISADINLLPFILARINSNNKLVLMTTLITPATTYKPYLPMLSAEIKALKPMDPRVNGY